MLFGGFGMVGFGREEEGVWEEERGVYKGKIILSWIRSILLVRRD